eukprot:CAMPEP_0194253286 /NCGR_PEP_ID=MMETSP0158-20130606/29522_1 /TAXON_ID=33649 /ORGANISM="Thalassionema nitzschioides, Strain L26-B" /LENGTH=316 /DNA_ID=CAMNT_0038990931 /DNA_START=16 /DNA_END=966 /DNA_ORIENTATION=-
MAPTRMKDRNSAWEKKFQQLKLFKAKHGHVNVQHFECRRLYSWIHSQRKRYREGTLEKGRYEMLSTVGFSWIHQDQRNRTTSKTERTKSRDSIKSSPILYPATPQKVDAAECLMQISRSKEELDTDDERDEYLVQDVEVTESAVYPKIDIRNICSVIVPFCDACKGSHPTHHKLCPKSSRFNRDKLEKIARGVNAGCAVCSREFENGFQTGRHDRHSIHCPRSKRYVGDVPTKKTVTPEASILTNDDTCDESIPKSLTLPLLPISANSPPRLPFVPPLITVDTFDLDSLIHDLEDGMVEDTPEILERLQKIRRLAY